jgi:hypothetical protein
MLAIGGWGSPSYVQSPMKKIGEDNRKVRKTDQDVSQAFAPGPKQDKIWTQWALNISSKTC